ncbi:lecithin retinol acyltransferase family protein [Bacterioplanoides pacificum]|uniref:Lecithin retinol acyltransferase family protein n=1 Tax=Bacterioplanoides pacificum TaxID=1171596 RepID=A0ABV7VPI7_9GAMM
MNNNLKSGDLLYRSKGIIQHAGVYLGNGQVLHNSPQNNVELISVDQYSEGKPVKVIRSHVDDHSLLTKRLERILNNDHRYEVVGNNCEHIAYMLIQGRKYSPQLQATLIGAILGGVAGSYTKSGNWLLFLLGGGIAGCLLSNLSRPYSFTYRLEFTG